MKQILVKTPRELSISAANEKEWVKDKQFILAKVPLKKLSVGCAQNISASNEIIIDVNKNKVSTHAADYIPKIIVLAGAAKVLQMRKRDLEIADCWVSLAAARELRLTASDQSGMGVNQLREELSALLQAQNKAKNSGNSICDSSEGWAYIVELYPDAKYFVYSKKGVFWKQSYTMIGKSQMVSFVGSPVRVKVTYSELSANSGLCINDEEVIRNYGAKTSDANNLSYTLMRNVVEAVKMYSGEIKAGKWIPQVNNALPIPKHMVHAAADALRAKSAETGLLPADFVVMDFIRWQDKQMHSSNLTKLVDSVELKCSSFAVVEDKNDPSTWTVPLNTSNRIKTALAYIKVHKTKPGVRERVLEAAELFNLV